jgi:hypothetical protein
VLVSYFADKPAGVLAKQMLKSKMAPHREGLRHGQEHLDFR